jgi:putative tryptophan/tyrosine transport system substrate-binding protein
MIRREFIAGLGGVVALPLGAGAQERERLRRIGVLTGFNESNPEGKRRYSAFTQALAGLGWIDGRNVRIDLRRWTTINQIGGFAQELVGLQPDAIFASNTPATLAFQRETRTIPIVFAGLGDPVGSGLVAALNQPGGNVTGFASYDAELGGKYLELLSEIAPGLKRAAIMFNPNTNAIGDTNTVRNHLPSFERAARLLKVVLTTAPVHSDVEIETAIIALGREPGGGLVVMPDIYTFARHVPIILAAARNNVPAVYWQSVFARDGGLLSYGPDPVDEWRRAATYVDRILRGAKPAELPVQLPTKFELVINLRTAKALGLTIPPNLLAIADEVIE